jgi:hypothetical protein
MRRSGYEPLTTKRATMPLWRAGQVRSAPSSPPKTLRQKATESSRVAALTSGFSAAPPLPVRSVNMLCEPPENTASTLRRTGHGLEDGDAILRSRVVARNADDVVGGGDVQRRHPDAREYLRRIALAVERRRRQQHCRAQARFGKIDDAAVALDARPQRQHDRIGAVGMAGGNDALGVDALAHFRMGKNLIEREAKVADARDRLLFLRSASCRRPTSSKTLPLHSDRSLPTCCRCRLA